jgi:hypothetical protein
MLPNLSCPAMSHNCNLIDTPSHQWIDFKAKSTTIQPLAAAYQLASTQATATQSSSTQPASMQTASAQATSAQATAAPQSNSSLASELQKANEELDVKHKKEYDRVIKDNIELLKEKENVLIQLHAQLKLQLEAQKFAAQQRARAIKEMQQKLKLEEEKSKKDAEEKLKQIMAEGMERSLEVMGDKKPEDKAEENEPEEQEDGNEVDESIKE